MCGGNFCNSRAKVFFDVLEGCRLVDLGTYGNKFTWFRNSQTSGQIAKRLEHALIDVNRRNVFLDAFVENLSHLYLDHSPIILHCSSTAPPRQHCSFRF